MSSTSGFVSKKGQYADKKVRQRKHGQNNDILASEEEVEYNDEKKYLPVEEPGVDAKVWRRLESITMPILFTAMAFFIRMYRIGASNRVVWDEAHFGKFGSYYLRHEFYHDVHPPLGKMLVGLSGHLAGYNGSWDFPSGQEYPDYIDYVKMRIFNAAFSALCVPIAYFTGKAIGYSLPSVWLLTVLVLFENSYTTLGRFILLDSMLLFFTVASFASFVMFHNQRSKPFSRKWWKWMIITGIALGCTISVKMVGLFIITVVGIYTVADLWNYLADKTMSWKTYIAHWLSRILCLIVIPMMVFMLCFKIHFDLLTHSGTGDANMSSLFQANLIGSSVGGGPRDVALGSSVVTFKNQQLGGALLHSHVQTYPEGSKQQQVTCYSHSDSNNDWLFQRVRELPSYNTNETETESIVDGGMYRLIHKNTGSNLHSHAIKAPLSNLQYEVSCYGNDTVGDPKDYWIVEVVDTKGAENATLVHPLTSSIRLKHAELGCYLAQTGNILPQWGFRQHEVVCLKNPFKRDKRTWWNIETHSNDKLPDRPANFRYPKTNFFKDFIQLNLAMMASNNALITDPEKWDRISSVAWQWPTLNIGLRMCGWGDDNVRYFLLGTPVSTWASSIAVVAFAITVVVLILKWQRQRDVIENPRKLNLFLIGGIYPMLAWGTHYVPFIIMARVTYVHHYLPALYFALLLLVYFFEAGLEFLNKSRTGSIIRLSIYAISMASVIACFYRFSPISFGMEGPVENFAYLDWLSTWTIGRQE